MSNFGVFASPERHLVFDVNDFDETGARALRVGREATGGEPGDRRARERFKAKQRRAVVMAAVTAYREAMRKFAQGSQLGRSGTPI